MKPGWCWICPWLLCLCFLQWLISPSINHFGVPEGQSNWMKWKENASSQDRTHQNCKYATFQQDWFVWNKGRRVLHSILKYLIFLLFERTPFSFWWTNLAETRRTVLIVILMCFSLWWGNFIKFDDVSLTFSNSEMADTRPYPALLLCTSCINKQQLARQRGSRFSAARSARLSVSGYSQMTTTRQFSSFSSCRQACTRLSLS